MESVSKTINKHILISENNKFREAKSIENDINKVLNILRHTSILVI